MDTQVARAVPMSKESMPIKKFLSQVEKRLSKCSADELRSILRHLATALPPDERRAFLKNLEPAAEEEDVLERKLQTDDLLLDIDDLIQEIKERTKSAEEYEFHHDYYDRYDDGDDEDSLGAYEDFVEPVGALFDRTEGVFD